MTTSIFSPDGRLIVTTSDDETARLWKASSGQLVVVLKGHTSNVRSAAFSPDGRRIVTAREDGTADVYSVATLADIANLLRE